MSHFSYFPSVGSLEAFTTLLQMYEEVTMNVTGRSLLPITMIGQQDTHDDDKDEKEVEEMITDGEEGEEEGGHKKSLRRSRRFA